MSKVNKTNDMPNNNRLQSVWTGLARNNRWSHLVRPRDIKTFQRRMECEGPEFYARGLGNLRTATLTGIGKGQYGGCRGFGAKKDSVLPRFLYGAFSRIFTDTGELHYNIDVDAVACVNQLTAIFTKIEGGHTPKSEDDVIESFVKTEKEIASTSIDYTQLIPKWISDGSTTVKRSWIPLETVMDEASRLIKRVLAGSDPREISPKHGSGVSACGRKPYDRYDVPRFVRAIDRIWPQTEYYFASLTALCDKMQEWYATECLDPCAKVLLVPKDARGPRLISCEPRETMWIQQGLMDQLYRTIEGHSLTRGLVNFTNQGYNQRAAFRGSLSKRVDAREGTTFAQFPLEEEELDINEILEACLMDHPCQRDEQADERKPSDGFLSNLDKIGRGAMRFRETCEYLRQRGLHLDARSPVAGKLATLDLKDASDRLRLDVVQRLFPSNWADALTAARSGQTELPDGRLVTLHKHAPMGSACCFPVMALVIWAVLTAIAPRSVRKHILVYGDDIVVPCFMAEDAIRALESIGFIVNTNKSFWQGPFRESCGEEFIYGARVTPVRMRMMPDDDDTSLMSMMALANNMLESPTIDDSDWFVELLRDWYGPQRVPTARRVLRKHVSWLDEVQRLQVGGKFASVTLSGVVFTDNPLMVQLPTGKDTKIHGANASVTKPAYWKRMYRIKVPVPRLEYYESDDWSHVLHALTLCGERTQLGCWVAHSRLRYQRRWVDLS